MNEEKGVVEYQARDGQKIKLSPQIIRNYLVSGRSEFVTDQELYLYMGVCKSRGLNPFVRDCHLVKYTQGDSAAIITSIDYYRKRARAQKDCKGWTVGIVILKNGELVYRKGTILLDDETLVGGWAEATPEGWAEPMRKEVNLKRYIKTTRDGGVTRFWQPMNQPEMIAKVAESQLLRSLWPDEFQGLYVDSEVQSRDAQEELHGAVAAGGGGPTAPAFEAVFAAEMADPMFGDFLAYMAGRYKMAEDAVKAEMQKQPENVRTGFAVYKESKAAKAGPAVQAAEKPVAAGAVEIEIEGGPLSEGELQTLQSGAESNGEEGQKPKTFRDEWVTMSAKSFGPFVQMEVERFKALPAEERAEAVEMWERFYPGFDCPFAGKDKTPEHGAGSGSAEEKEMDALRAELRALEKKHGRVVLAAKKATQIVLPSSVDGFRMLIEKTRELLNEKKGG